MHVAGKRKTKIVTYAMNFNNMVLIFTILITAICSVVYIIFANRSYLNINPFYKNMVPFYISHFINFLFSRIFQVSRDSCTF